MTDEAQPFLPYARHLIDEEDIAAVTEVLRGDWLTTGPAVAAFEEALAAKVGARFAVSCTSGTAALHLATLALGLGEGQVSVVPSLTFLATANATRHAGGEVAFADVDPETGLAGEDTLEAAIQRAGVDPVKAIYPVHLNGQCVDMRAVGRLAAKYGLRVIEDACHALGAEVRTAAGEGDGVAVGGCQDSDMAIFSFHAVKAIAMGEGGAVTTNDAALHERLVRLRNHGMVRDGQAFQNAALALDEAGAANPWYYEMPEIGFNYRASDIHCALGLSQLAKLDRFVAARRELVRRYDERLEDLAPAVRPVRRVEGCIPAWHLYVVLIDFAALGADRAAVMRRLRAAGIGAQVHYLPLHLQPYYQNRYGAQSLPGAERYYARALTLPLFAGMTAADVERVVEALRASLG